MDSRSGEDMFSVILSSLEELAKSSGKINKKIVFSLILLLLWCVLDFFLWITSIIEMSIFDIISSTLLLLIVLFVIMELLDIREKLAVVVSRYQSYRFMEKMDLQIPEGKDEVERFLNYLNKNLHFEERLKKRNGKIIKNVEIDCGEKVHFDLYAYIKRGIFDRIKGTRSYSFYLVKTKDLSIEKLEEFISLVKKCSEKNKVEIGRAVLIVPEMTDEVYEFMELKKVDIPLQVVMEMEDGTYDFIPFISPRHDFLP